MGWRVVSRVLCAILALALTASAARAQGVGPGTPLPREPRRDPAWPPGWKPDPGSRVPEETREDREARKRQRKREQRLRAGPPSEDTAQLLSWAGLVVPAGVGTGVWVAQKRPTGLSVILIGAGVTKGAALGYEYAGMDEQAHDGIELRSMLLLGGLLAALSLDEPAHQTAAIAAGCGASGLLAVIDVELLRDRFRKHRSGWRLEPASLRTSDSPALALTRRF